MDRSLGQAERQWHVSPQLKQRMLEEEPSLACMIGGCGWVVGGSGGRPRRTVGKSAEGGAG